MLFNTIEFAVFLPIVFLLYWFVFSKNAVLQNLLLILSSCVFYAWWDCLSLLLLSFTILSTYLLALGIKLYQSSRWFRKPSLLLCTVSIALNLGILCIFKYYNFLFDSFINAFSLFGKQLEPSTFHFILPLGISFYALRLISYTVDVYNNKIEPTRNFLAFFAFAIFFPLLLAGPIERATNSLHQFLQKRVFAYQQSLDGLRQILYGLFKKVVVADNCALIVNNIFSQNPANLNGSTLLGGAFFFTFQIYCDFSGYSDMAIGISKIFGIEVTKNFNYPYFSRNVAEFWRRWHISLTTWFRDYLYIPLGGSRTGKWKTIRNTLIVFLVSGLWHGANWTFVVWGLFHALLFLPLLILDRNRIYAGQVAYGQLLPSVKEFFQMALTFTLVMIGWVFFRAETIGGAIQYINGIASWSLFSFPSGIKEYNLLICSLFVIVMFVIEWFQRENANGLNLDKLESHIVKYFIYIAMALTIFCFRTPKQSFIYMQF